MSLSTIEGREKRACHGFAERVARQSGVTSPRIVDAFRAVPRDAFVPEAARERSFLDQALPIGEGQTISQPSMIAIMFDRLSCEPQHRVLEVGSGSGYAAALLSRLACEVHGVERYAELARRSRETLERLGVEGVTIHERDGTLGLPAHAPFDRILVSAGAPAIPERLLSQLASGGILVMPVGGENGQTLVTCQRDHRGELHYEAGVPCIFVPLISSAQGERV